MAEKKKGFRLRFWKKKEKDLPEVELTRKPKVIDLHSLLLGLEQEVAVETEVSAEDENTASARPTRLGFINTTNPIVKDGATKLCIFLFDEIRNLEFMSGTGAGVFTSILDYVGREALIAIQSMITSRMEEIVADGASPDDGEVFSQGDLETILDNFRSHLSLRFDESTVAAYALAFQDCLMKVNTVVIDVTKSETDDDEYSVTISEFQYLTLNESNVLMENQDPNIRRVVAEDEVQGGGDRPNGAAGGV